MTRSKRPRPDRSRPRLSAGSKPLRRPADRIPRPQGKARPAPVSAVQGRSWKELVEGLQAEFEEAGDHLLHRPETVPLQFGPVRLIEPHRLTPGAFGWEREVRRPIRPTTSPGADSDARVGWLYFVAHPEVPTGASGELPANPIVGVQWSAFAYSEEFRSHPRILLAARSDSVGDSLRLRQLAEALRSELEADAD